jgi:N-acetylglucosamine malate deacetylase 2
MRCSLVPLLDERLSLNNQERGPLRTLVLVAHQDDETACAGLLQRLADPVIVYATNGAPADHFFWRRQGSRNAYAAMRREEAQVALSFCGVRQIEFLNDHAPAGQEFEDQRLYRVLPEAVGALRQLVAQYRPAAIVAPAYEGGHPDHDSCSFLGFLLGWLCGIPVCEMPLYHRSESGDLVCQRFRDSDGSEQALVLTARERSVRDEMIAAYASQNVSEFVSVAAEQYRPQADYDYTRPPHAGTLNYQAWNWPIEPMDLCRAFAECASHAMVASNRAGCAPAFNGAYARSSRTWMSKET